MIPLSEPARDISFETPAAARVRIKQIKPKPHAVERADALLDCTCAPALTAKIGILHGRIVQQCCGLALNRDAAVFEHIDTVGDAERHEKGSALNGALKFLCKEPL